MAATMRDRANPRTRSRPSRALRFPTFRAGTGHGDRPTGDAFGPLLPAAAVAGGRPHSGPASREAQRNSTPLRIGGLARTRVARLSQPVDRGSTPRVDATSSAHSCRRQPNLAIPLALPLAVGRVVASPENKKGAVSSAFLDGSDGTRTRDLRRDRPRRRSPPPTTEN